MIKVYVCVYVCVCLYLRKAFWTAFSFFFFVKILSAVNLIRQDGYSNRQNGATGPYSFAGENFECIITDFDNFTNILMTNQTLI